MNTGKIADEIIKYLEKQPNGRYTKNGLMKAIDLAMPNARMKALDKANEYLVEGFDDISVEEMVERIANQSDKSVLIDSVDGVNVWEKVEMQFTCEYFLQLIGWDLVEPK